MGDQACKDLLLGVGKRTHRNIVLSNLVGAVLAAASGALTDQNIKGQPGFGPVDAATLGVYLVLTLLIGTWLGRKNFSKATAWLDQGRDPTPVEYRSTLRLPLWNAEMSMVGWAGAAAVWALLTAMGHPWDSVVRVSASILLGGLATSVLTYLLVEWSQRPLVRLALAARAPEGLIVPGVRTRLIASWAIGADVFLLMIGLTFVGRPSSQPPNAGAIWFIVAAGLAAGTLVVYTAARSLAVPLRTLRAAVNQVQRGELDVAVDVDDAGEMGLLQDGFNRMVAGLRERNVLQDLFGRHVGDEVARQALERGISLGGERREVGVLFVDILGSTALSVRYPPDQVVALLNSFFAAVIRVVAAEGGWVNKFEGDGALCVFGAPIPMEDHAVRALRAARSIRREVLALAALHPELDSAVGVSAGTVVAGNVGAEQRYEYTVIGTPVNEAARLTDEAKKRLSRVLASEEALGRATAAESAEWMVAGEIRLRGLELKQLVYEPATGETRVRESSAVRSDSRSSSKR